MDAARRSACVFGAFMTTAACGSDPAPARCPSAIAAVAGAPNAGGSAGVDDAGASAAAGQPSAGSSGASDSGNDAIEPSGDSGAQDAAGGDAQSGSTACSSSTDCVHTEYYKPVTSVADCYCRPCPGDFGRQPPLNVETHTLYEEQWAAMCTEWQQQNPCLPQLCTILPAPVCASGQCAFAPS